MDLNGQDFFPYMSTSIKRSSYCYCHALTRAEDACEHMLANAPLFTAQGMGSSRSTNTKLSVQSS